MVELHEAIDPETIINQEVIVGAGRLALVPTPLEGQSIEKLTMLPEPISLSLARILRMDRKDPYPIQYGYHLADRTVMPGSEEALGGDF
jgi:hypothetical protein